jgi:hypothetical protein
MTSPGKREEVDAPVRENPKKVVAYVDGRWCHRARFAATKEIRHHVQGDLEKLVGQLDFDAALAGNWTCASCATLIRPASTKAIRRRRKNDIQNKT